MPFLLLTLALACGGSPPEPPFGTLEGAPVVSPDGKITVTPTTSWSPSGVPVSNVGDRRPGAVSISLHVADPGHSLPSLVGMDGMPDHSGDVTRTVLVREVGHGVTQEEAVRLAATAPQVRFLPDGHSVEVGGGQTWEKVELRPVEKP